jgi:hypothetical protein
MDPFNFPADLIRWLIIILFIGIPVVRAIYRAFVKPVAKVGAGERRRPPAERPAIDLQEFLKEVRRGRPEAKGPPEPRGVGAERHLRMPGGMGAPGKEIVMPRGGGMVEVLVEEPRQPAAPAAGPPPVASPFPARDVQRPGRPPGARKERRKPPAEEAPPAGGEPEKRRRPLARELDEREISQVSARHIRSTVAARHLAPQVEERHLESQLPQALAEKFGSARSPEAGASGAALPGLPPGVGLREAVVLQTIFGSPRSKGPWAHPRRGGLRRL